MSHRVLRDLTWDSHSPYLWPVTCATNCFVHLLVTMVWTGFSRLSEPKEKQTKGGTAFRLMEGMIEEEWDNRAATVYPCWDSLTRLFQRNNNKKSRTNLTFTFCAGVENDCLRMVMYLYVSCRFSFSQSSWEIWIFFFLQVKIFTIKTIIRYQNMTPKISVVYLSFLKLVENPQRPLIWLHPCIYLDVYNLLHIHFKYPSSVTKQRMKILDV